MKNLNLRHVLLLVVLSVFIIPGLCQTIDAQNTKKISLRIKADYSKVIDESSYIDITTSARIDRRNTAIANINLTIVNDTDDEDLELGEVTTDHDGKSRFYIKDLNTLPKDSLGIYSVNFRFKGNDVFKKASKTVAFKDAYIDAKSFTKDSINYISATIKDVFLDSLLAKTALNVSVERLFKSLPIGEEFNYTDENGTILVPLEEGIPGVDGNLIVEVILSDSDDYGTVKALVNAPFGKPVVFDNSFDKRTLWSTRDKTPIFILIFANLLIFSIWGIFIYLIINLFKIKKS